MSLADRLKQLDDRILPAKLRGNYDAPRPLWLLYAGVVNSLAAVIFVVGIARGHGSVRVVVCLLAALVLLANTAAAVRWDRAHRANGAET